MPDVSVRYIVDDVDTAIDFYRDRLGFEIAMKPGPGFAALTRGPLRLLLSEPAGSSGAAQATHGPRHEPGGWNRIQLTVEDLEAEVEALRSAGARFRGDIVQGRGGRQALVEDPSGNPVELFHPGG